MCPRPACRTVTHAIKGRATARPRTANLAAASAFQTRSTLSRTAHVKILKINRARTRTQAAPRDPRPTPIQHEHTARTAPDKQEHHALSGTACGATMMVPPCNSTQTAHSVAAVDSCSRVAWLQRRPLTESMSAAIFSSASTFSMTGSTSRPACRMSKERRRSDQRDDRASAETSSRA